MDTFESTLTKPVREKRYLHASKDLYSDYFNHIKRKAATMDDFSILAKISQSNFAQGEQTINDFIYRSSTGTSVLAS